VRSALRSIWSNVNVVFILLASVRVGSIPANRVGFLGNLDSSFTTY
jgi:hypothetical protein